MIHIKCLAVGYENKEKVRFLKTYTTGCYSPEPSSSVFDNYSGNVMCDNIQVNLQLWDTTVPEGFGNTRRFSYPQTDVFLVFFFTYSSYIFRTSKKHIYS